MTHRERMHAALRHQHRPLPLRDSPPRRPMPRSSPTMAATSCSTHRQLGCWRRPPRRDRWLSDTVWQDEFGVQWDHSIDRDIGNVCSCVLPERDLSRLELPDPDDPRSSRVCRYGRAAAEVRQLAPVRSSSGLDLARHGGALLRYARAPPSSTKLLDAICDYNVALVRRAVTYDMTRSTSAMTGALSVVC